MWCMALPIRSNKPYSIKPSNTCTIMSPLYQMVATYILAIVSCNALCIKMYATAYDQTETHGSSAFIDVNHVRVTSGLRGHNVVVLNAAGEYESFQAFDTFWRDADAPLEAYLQSIPANKTVAIVTQDSGFRIANYYVQASAALLESWGCANAYLGNTDSLLFLGAPTSNGSLFCQINRGYFGSTSKRMMFYYEDLSDCQPIMALIDSSYSTTVSIIYFALNITLMFGLALYVYKSGNHQLKSKSYVKDVWSQRKIFLPLIIHFYDTATDIGVIYNWGELMNQETGEIDYESVDMNTFFWCGVAFLIVFRVGMLLYSIKEWWDGDGEW
eukprot:234882_1